MEAIRHGDLRVVRFVNSIYASNTYLLCEVGCRDAWLVDCGDIDPVIHRLTEEQSILRGVFLTHVHYDHIYGLNKLTQYFPSLPVYTTEAGLESLHSSKYNFSKYHGIDFHYESGNITLLHDGDRLELSPTRTISCLETPGHDWSSLTFRTSDWLFTGDAYIPGVKTVASFPKSNRQQAIISLVKIRKLITSHTLICPGHGPISMNPMF